MHSLINYIKKKLKENERNNEYIDLFAFHQELDKGMERKAKLMIGYRIEK